MFEKKFPRSATISSIVLSSIAVPTAIGSCIKLAAKIPQIIKTANDVKNAIPQVQKMAEELSKQFETKSENVESNIKDNTIKVCDPSDACDSEDKEEKEGDAEDMG